MKTRQNNTLPWDLETHMISDRRQKKNSKRAYGFRAVGKFSSMPHLPISSHNDRFWSKKEIGIYQVPWQAIPNSRQDSETSWGTESEYLNHLSSWNTRSSASMPGFQIVPKTCPICKHAQPEIPLRLHCSSTSNDLRLSSSAARPPRKSHPHPAWWS